MARAGNKEPREWVAATVLGTASHLAEKQSKCAWEHVGHSDIQPCPSYILVLGLCAAMQPGIHKELLHRAILKDTPTHPGHTTQKKHTMRLKPWRKEPKDHPSVQLPIPPPGRIHGEGPGAQALLGLSWQPLFGCF